MTTTERMTISTWAILIIIWWTLFWVWIFFEVLS